MVAGAQEHIQRALDWWWKKATLLAARMRKLIGVVRGGVCSLPELHGALAARRPETGVVKHS